MSSPLISKGSYSDIKSPYASPFLLKEMGIHYLSSINHKDKGSDHQTKPQNNNLFSLNTLSPLNPHQLASGSEDS